MNPLMFMFVGHFCLKKKKRKEEKKGGKTIKEKKFPGQKDKLWAKIRIGD